MEKVDTNYNPPEEGKSGENVTLRDEIVIEGIEMNGHNLKTKSDDFLKHEGEIKLENTVPEETMKHDTKVHIEVGSVSSSNLINAELLTSSSDNTCGDNGVSKNVEKPVKESLSPCVQNSGDINGHADDVVTDNKVDEQKTLTEDKESEISTGYKSEAFGGNSFESDSSTVEAMKNSKSEAVSGNSSRGDHSVDKKTENSIFSQSADKVGTSIEETSNDSNEETAEEWMDILGSGHLMKKVLKPGIPNTRPQTTDICILSLIGKLENGTVVEKAENLEINLSDNEVIQGLDFALALMDKGEEAEIKVTPRFGYGSLGKKPDIPSGANLLYFISLHDVRKEPQINTLSVMDRIKNGLRKKERGNWWYARDENTLAINCYRRALDYLDDTDIPEPHSEEDVHKLLEERLKTYNNLGAAQMKISAFDAALMSVNNVLTSQPENVKALFRKSKILKEKGELQESINTVKKALTYEPDSQTLQQELSVLMAAQRKANSKQRELYKKMMGNNNNQAEEDNKKNSKSNYKTFTMVAAVSFAVAVLGTIVVKYKF